MMKYQIHGEDVTPETVHPITLKLVRHHNQTHVCSVDENGDVHYYLITFKADGTVKMNGFLPKSLGFQLDEYQAIVISP